MGATEVTALAAFAREFPREFERHEGKALSFAMARMSGAIGVGEGREDEEEVAKKGGKKKKRGGGGKGAAATAVSSACLTLCASIKLACNCLMAPGRATDVSGGAEDRGEAWLRTLFALLKADGQPESEREREMGEAERAELRLAGSTRVMRLCVNSANVQVC